MGQAAWLIQVALIFAVSIGGMSIIKPLMESFNVVKLGGRNIGIQNGIVADSQKSVKTAAAKTAVKAKNTGMGALAVGTATVGGVAAARKLGVGKRATLAAAGRGATTGAVAAVRKEKTRPIAAYGQAKDNVKSAVERKDEKILNKRDKKDRALGDRFMALQQAQRDNADNPDALKKIERQAKKEGFILPNPQNNEPDMSWEAYKAHQEAAAKAHTRESSKLRRFVGRRPRDGEEMPKPKKGTFMPTRAAALVPEALRKKGAAMGAAAVFGAAAAKGAMGVARVPNRYSAVAPNAKTITGSGKGASKEAVAAAAAAAAKAGTKGGKPQARAQATANPKIGGVPVAAQGGRPVTNGATRRATPTTPSRGRPVPNAIPVARDPLHTDRLPLDMSNVGVQGTLFKTADPGKAAPSVTPDFVEKSKRQPGPGQGALFNPVPVQDALVDMATNAPTPQAQATAAGIAGAAGVAGVGAGAAAAVPARPTRAAQPVKAKPVASRPADNPKASPAPEAQPQRSGATAAPKPSGGTASRIPTRRGKGIRRPVTKPSASANPNPKPITPDFKGPSL